MKKYLDFLVKTLSYGEPSSKRVRDSGTGLVTLLARIYEKARNSLEFRADHLVRRAAVERILKRRLIFHKEPRDLASLLITELRWARYLEDFPATDKKIFEDLTKILEKYIDYLKKSKGKIPFEWLVKIASAEIEEALNLNKDYLLFTFFAFHYFKKIIHSDKENFEPLLFYAVDKVYGDSDDEQIAFHIFKLIQEEVKEDTLEKAYLLFKRIKRDKNVGVINRLVRRRMGHLVLLRDIYFYSPLKFEEAVKDREKFFELAEEVVNLQIAQMNTRISTAARRSVVYIFLTKILIALAVELPMERFIYHKFFAPQIAFNILFPPFIMWLLTLGIKTPIKEELDELVEKTWELISGDDSFQKVHIDVEHRKIGLSFANIIFSVFYLVLFIVVFGGIFYLLNRIGFNILNQIIFVFFLALIVFFAYRIKQTTLAYLLKEDAEEIKFLDILSLPIIWVGNKLSRTLEEFNFLIFAFDFLLEAPFKLILELFDNLFHFLAIKKEELINE